jgi:signal transduction histidine kinase
MVGMTGSLLLDWAILTLSLFNTIVLLWLSMTVLLNADRRHWGVWLMGAGLLAGAAFFVSHTAILGQELMLNADGLNFWWQVGWIPVTVAPFAWYVVSLWYSGFWTQGTSDLRQRHRVWFVAMTTLAASLVILLITAKPIPSYEEIVRLELMESLTLGGVPVLFLIFPVFMTACIGLSIDVLWHPAPAERFSSELARRRSRPWLVGTAVMLLAVSVLVAMFIIGVVQGASEQAIARIALQTIGLFDLALQVLIAIASVLLGQAVVSYEVFTGKVLPRRGFFRQWRNLVVIAAGYSGVVAVSLVIHLRPVYSLLLATMLMVAFYALYSWRSFVEREQFMTRLRPFVGPQDFVSRLLANSNEGSSKARELFYVVCRDILGATQAQLSPLGVLASLAGPGFVYPSSNAVPYAQTPTNLLKDIIELEPDTHDGYCWAVPLWAERGLIGVVLIGAKQDGGLYTQEEMEIAQAAGERLVDMLAGEQMAKSLMQLQRQRVTANRVVDMRMRRTLHDEVLPTIHAAILQAGGAAADQTVLKEVVESLSEAHRTIYDLLHSPSSHLPNGSGQSLDEGVRRLIAHEFSHAFNSVDTEGSVMMPLDSFAEEVLFGAIREVIRNAAVHGRGGDENRPLRLRIQLQQENDMSIKIVDDGVGLGSKQQSPGSGSGLALHSTLLATIGGTLSLHTFGNGGTEATISIPVSKNRAT